MSAGVALVPGSPWVAESATVSVRPSTKPIFSFGPPMELVYVAAAGERNRTVVQVASQWTVTDPGAVIEPGDWCSALDAHTATCSLPGSDSSMYLPQLRVADVRTGDLDDEVTLLQPPRPPGLISELGATFPLYADGGVGNDHLSAEDSDGELYGGPGDDRLSGSKALDGGGGRDELYGDSRNETFSDGDLDGAAGDAAPGPDLIDGGGGNDTVSYRQRRTSVSVSLAAERAGSLGEADVVRGVESIIGGNGDDLLQGDDGPNMIDGQQGRDKLIGGGGDDQFVNGRGKITCGDGVDLVVSPRASDRLGRGCEQITTVLDGEDIFAAYPFKRGMRSVWFAIHCPSRAREDLAGRYRCSARMTITEAAGARRRIAAGTSARGRWAHRAVRLPLTRVGRQLAASRRLVPAVVSLSIDGGELPTLRWGILL